MGNQIARMGCISKKISRRDSYQVKEAKPTILANKNLDFGEIKFFGFDMDYTLVEYKSPNLEIMTYKLLVKRMIEIGYPKDLKSYKYDPSFPSRGLWVDSKFGNLIKTDGCGNILMCFHGFTKLTNSEIESQYPNRSVDLDLSRIMVANTMYNLPEIFLIATTISHFENMKNCEKRNTEFSLNGKVAMKYATIIQDIRNTMNHVHMDDKKMSENILENPEKFVKKSPKLADMLVHLKSNGAKVFLLTNSDHEYTKKILQFIFNLPSGDCDEWKSHFDYIVTSANKPKFFSEGTPFERVNELSNTFDTVDHSEEMVPGSIYSGGSVESFSKMISANAHEILYFGDHILGDILKPKKLAGWKTSYITPELFPEVNTLKKKTNIKSPYVEFGKPLHHDNRKSFYVEQVMRYADIYIPSCINLLDYGMTHQFRVAVGSELL